MTDVEVAERPDWDLTWMRMARVIARRSLCDGEKVGAVIASSDNRVVAVGYNNPPAGFAHQGRSCLAWCPRMKASRRITGYEMDAELMRTAPNQLTRYATGDYDYESSDYRTYVEVNNWQRFFLSETAEETMIEVMASCGFKPTYGKSDGSYANCPSLHAEANAISVCDRTQREDGTIYTTSIPCMDCAKLIANSGVKVVVYRNTPRGQDRAKRTDESPLAFLAECGIVTRQL